MQHKQKLSVKKQRNPKPANADQGALAQSHDPGGGMIAVRAEFSGPLPHPRMFEAYERTLPGSADRILAMAEREQAHINREESQSRFEAHQEQKLGKILGAALSLALLICVTLLAALEKTLPSILVAVGGGGFIAVALALIRSERERARGKSGATETSAEI